MLMSHTTDGPHGARRAEPLLWPPAFQGAIFDFDGTVALTGGIWERVDREFLSARNLEYTSQFARDLSLLGFERGARFVVERFGLDEDPADICREWNRIGARIYAQEVSLRPGAAQYILTLRRTGVRCALATTNDANVIDSMKPRVDADLLFDARVHGSEVARTKEFPDIYLEAASRLGVDPGRCVVFEDIAPGLRSASLAGMTTCAVRSDDPGQDEKELARAADLWLDDWRDIALPADAVADDAGTHSLRGAGGAACGVRGAGRGAAEVPGVAAGAAGGVTGAGEPPRGRKG